MPYSRHPYKPISPSKPILTPVPEPISPTDMSLDLSEMISFLEASGGNLRTFLASYTGVEPSQYEAYLFAILQKLSEPENEHLKRRWEKALNRSAQVRFLLLQCKAFETLERFSNPADKSPSPEVAFCNLILRDKLLARDAKYKSPPTQPTDSQKDEIDEDLEMLSNGDPA